MCAVFIEGGWVGFAAYEGGTGALKVAIDIKCPPGQDGHIHAAKLCAGQECVSRVLCQTSHQNTLKDVLGDILGESGAYRKHARDCGRSTLRLYNLSHFLGPAAPHQL